MYILILLLVSSFEETNIVLLNAWDPSAPTLETVPLRKEEGSDVYGGFQPTYFTMPVERHVLAEQTIIEKLTPLATAEVGCALLSMWTGINAHAEEKTSQRPQRHAFLLKKNNKKKLIVEWQQTVQGKTLPSPQRYVVMAKIHATDNTKK